MRARGYAGAHREIRDEPADDPGRKNTAGNQGGRDRSIQRTETRQQLRGIDRRRERAAWRAYAKHGVDPFGIDAQPRLDEVAVARALGHIAKADRDALLLMVWADLTYDDIATALGVPVGTVRSRIHRARARLRVELESLR